MLNIAGLLLAIVYVGGSLASLAIETWTFARLYRDVDSFRHRANDFFAERPGPLGQLIRIIMAAGVGLGLIVNAVMWPGILLYDLFTPTRPGQKPTP